MSDLRNCGYFHRDDQLQKRHPVDLLEHALRKSGLESLFSESLLVLPEAFNIVGEYYRLCAPDAEVQRRLAALSARLGLCFVVGFVRDDADRYSEAVLIDGGKVLEVLSLKTLWDGSPCYAPFKGPAQDRIVLHRNLRIGGLVCMDATEGQAKDVEMQRERHDETVRKLSQYAEATLLCVPGRFRGPSPDYVAKEWNRRKTSIIIGNCGIALTHPSVLHFANGQTCSAPTDGDCYVHLAPLPLPKAS